MLADMELRHLRYFVAVAEEENIIAEEHDSSTSLIAAVEAGRGVALIQKGFERLAGPRLKVRALVPAPEPVVVGVACRKGKCSAAAERFIAVLKRSAWNGRVECEHGFR